MKHRNDAGARRGCGIKRFSFLKKQVCMLMGKFQCTEKTWCKRQGDFAEAALESWGRRRALAGRWVKEVERSWKATADRLCSPRVTRTKVITGDECVREGSAKELSEYPY